MIVVTLDLVLEQQLVKVWFKSISKFSVI